MSPIRTSEDLRRLRESVAVECKLAGGRDGQGAVPEDFWATYSAFANTQGGVILLGIREKRNEFSVEGIANAAKVRKELFDTLNNRQKVSVNLLNDEDVAESAVDGRTVLVVRVPRAARKQRPVHLTKNPFGNTYRRLNDGDRVVADEEVRRLIAEQVEDSRDERILEGYSVADLNAESLRAYRNMFKSAKPDHPWVSLDDADFVRSIGGWRRDRVAKTEGLTLAGLLMFGTGPDIAGESPNYLLDYREQPDAKDETRWTDRVTLDGTWSGNLFDFFRKVSPKLQADLKVPFVLHEGVRQDDTPAHKAVREALVNAIVHADYTDRASVLIIKRRDGFLFRNPGLMRVPPAVALLGGESDCRNRTLHGMFLLVGLGERAGSGLSRIRKGWTGKVSLADTMEPYDQTRLELMLPKEAVNAGAGKGSVKSTVESTVESAVKTTLKTDQKTTLKTTLKSSEKILSALRGDGSLSREQLATLVGVSPNAVKQQLAKLKATGRLRRIGPDKGGHWEVVE